MTDQHLSELLGRAADRVPVGPAPVTAIVGEAGRARRRRTVARLAAAAAVAAVVGGVAALSLPGGGAEPQPAAPAPAAPPEGTRFVGLGHAAIAVPQDWGTNLTRCGTPRRDTVVIDVGMVPLCAAPRPAGVESVEVSRGEPRSGFSPDESFTVDGVAAERQATTCEGDGFDEAPVCSGAVFLPAEGVFFRAESSTGPAEVDRILRGIRVLPDHVGVPGYQLVAGEEQERGATAYAQVLRDAGFDVETRVADGGRVPDGHVLGVDPAPGTMLSPGAVVTVTVAGEPGSSAGAGPVLDIDEGVRTAWDDATAQVSDRDAVARWMIEAEDSANPDRPGRLAIVDRSWVPCSRQAPTDPAGPVDPLEPDARVADYAQKLRQDYGQDGVWVGTHLVVHPDAASAQAWLDDFSGGRYDPGSGISCAEIDGQESPGYSSSYDASPDRLPGLDGSVVMDDRRWGPSGPLGRVAIRVARVGNAVLTTVAYSPDAKESELSGIVERAEAEDLPVLERYAG